MKVLHLINNLGSGGAEKMLESIIPLMNQLEDIDVDILLLTDKNNVFYDSLVNKGIKVDIIKYKNMYDIRNVFEIKKHITCGKYDIVHSHLFPTQYWVALSRLIMKKNKVKFITTEHSTYNRRRESLFFKPIDKFIYSKYDVIISITEKTKANLIKWIDSRGKKAYKQLVIENGIDIQKIKNTLPYNRADLTEGIDENTKLICMVGRFYEAKDQPTLIKAMTKLSEDVHLILVGEGPLMNAAMELANQLGLSDRVHFLGFREDIPQLLKTIDIVVLSSHWEGFSLAAFEGMAAEKPVIISNIEGIKDLIEDKELKFEAGNFIDLAEKINILLCSNDIYSSKVEYLNKICMAYDINNKVKDLEKLYKTFII